MNSTSFSNSKIHTDPKIRNWIQEKKLVENDDVKNIENLIEGEGESFETIF